MKRSAPFASLFLVLLLHAAPASPQGCAQCRDNAAATPPKTQTAYRHAIILMVVTAGSLFAATVWMFKKNSSG